MFSCASQIVHSRRTRGLFTTGSRCATPFAAAIAGLLVLSSAKAGTVTQVGTLRVSADTAVTPTFSPLTLPPIIAEDVATDWQIGTAITLSAPAGFRFNTAPLSVTATITAGDIDLGPGPGNPATVTPGETTIVYFVVVASTGASQITFTGIELRAENCAAAAVGNAPDITVTINDPTLGAEPELTGAQLVDVTVLAGAIDHFTVQSTPAVQPAGSPYTITLTARDQCNNPIADFDPAADIVITAAGGTGTRIFGIGTFTVNDPIVTDNTALLPDVPGNVFNAVGQGTFTVTSPIGEGPITISAALGAVTGQTNVTWLDGTCNLTPATDTNDVGTPHVVTASISVNGAAAPGVAVAFSVAGANTVGPAPGVPPLTNALGQTTFTYAGANIGVDTITAQFTVAGQLKTCTASKTWVNPACALTPPTHIGVVGLAHTVNINVTGLAGGLEANGTFTITTGPNAGLSQPFTTVAGAASFIYNSNGLPGTDSIVASGNVAGIPFNCGPVTKEWVSTGCGLTPSVDTNLTGTPHTVTVTVLKNGAPEAGVTVVFSVAGANAGAVVTVSGTTNGAGVATGTYTGLNNGTDTITASGNIIVGGVPVPFLCSATKIWLTPACTLTAVPPTAGQVGASVTLTAAITQNALAVGAGLPVTFNVISGPNAGLILNTATIAGGTATFTYNGSAGVGTDTIRASGSMSGVPFECFTTKAWIIDSTCTMTPPTDINPLGTLHTVTVTVTANGGPAVGVPVTFGIVGPNAAAPLTLSNAGSTDAAGQVTATYTGTNIGSDTINASGNVGGDPFACSAAKEWITATCTLAAVPATPGQVGETVTATTTIQRSGVNVGAGVPVSFSVISGPNTGLVLNTATGAGGTASFTYTGSVGVGTDTIRANGVINGVPFECTTTKAWAIDSTCTMTPPTDINPVGALHTVTVQVSANGAPVVGTLVTFVIVGPNAAAPLTLSNGGFTNGSGQVTATYTGTNTGSDTITANGTIGGDPFSCSAVKEWITASCSLAAVPATPGQVGDTVTVTSTVQRSGVNVGAGVPVTFNVISGPNAGAILNTATGAGGTASFTYTGSAGVGTDTIRANGIIDGVPFECTTTKAWTIDSTCTMTPPTDINPVGSQHTVTVQVLANGGPAVGILVTFGIVGPNAAALLTLSNGGNTDGTGRVTATYTGTNIGTDTITASGNVGGDPFSCSAVKQWITATCSLAAVPAASSDVGTSVTVTSTVQRNGANVGAGIAVTFNVISGPNAGAILNTATGAGGTAAFTYTGNAGVGTDTIRATSTVDGIPIECTTTKVWVDPSCNITAAPPTLVGTQNTVTVTVLNGAAPAVGINVALSVVGANNAVRNATTGAGGVATFAAYTGANPGTDNLTVTGDIDGVPFTCTSTKDWISSGCSLVPAADSNQVGTSHSVTVTILNGGLPAPGVFVFFSVSGRNSVLDAKITNLVGQATLNYNDTGNPNVGGTDTITASYALGGLNFSCPATKNWIIAACNLTPATDTNPIGTNHTVTVTVSSNGLPVPPDGNQVQFEILAGSPNAGGPFPRNSVGNTANFTYAGNGGIGTDTIRVTGTVNGVPFSCLATKTWITSGCSLTPPTETNVVNQSHSVTSTVVKNGAGAPGITVNFLVTAGPNAGKVGVIVTNASGQAIFTYTGTNAAGTDTIQASGVVDGVPFNCTATKTWIADTNNGIPPDVEDQGPNNGDGNNDGIKDSLQANVATFPDFFGHFVTIESPAGTTLQGVAAITAPDEQLAPPGVIFPYGFFKFEVHGVPTGGCVNVRIFLHGGPTVNTYYKFGPSPIVPVDHYFRFQFDGALGAEVNGDIITLHLCDGQRGDLDLAANGVIKEPGGPALEAENPAPLSASATCGACGAGFSTAVPVLIAGLWLMRRDRRRSRRGAGW